MPTPRQKEIDSLCPGCMKQRSEGPVCSHCGFDENAPPSVPYALPPRTILQNQYVIGRVLGCGGFGITYLGWDLNLNLKLAIKEYFPSQLVSRDGASKSISVHSQEAKEQFQVGLAKFLEEGRTLARFQGHPGIVSVNSYLAENYTGYLVMNYVEGTTFKEYLEQRGGKIPIAVATRVMMPVMDALSEVHAVGILHRDISPDNIYITSSGQVKLLDFGAARVAPNLSQQNLSVIFKPGFAPPEQYMSEGRQGPWTDVYALAATIYRAITGQLPSQSVERFYKDELPTPSALGVEISDREESVLMKALAVDFSKRFQTMREFQNALFLPDPPHAEIPRTNRDPRDSDSTTGNAKSKPSEKVSNPERLSLKVSKKTLGLVIGGVALLLFALSHLWTGTSSDLDPIFVGNWVARQTISGAKRELNFQISPSGQIVATSQFRDTGLISITGNEWHFSSESQNTLKGKYRFHDGGSADFEGLPQLTSETVSMTKSMPHASARDWGDETLVGDWNGNADDELLTGKWSISILDNGEATFILDSKSTRQLTTKDGQWELRQENGTLVDSGKYTVLDGASKRILLRGKHQLTLEPSGPR